MESGRIGHPVPREFYKERDVVMEERRMRTDSNPIGRMVEQFLATAYVAHPYGRPGVGWESELSQIDATEAAAFHKKYYTPSTCDRGCRRLKASTTMPIMEKYFDPIPAGPQPEPMTTVSRRRFREVGHHSGGDATVLHRGLSPQRLSRSGRPGVRRDYRHPLERARVAPYRSLVRDQRIAAEAEGFSGFPGTKYPGLFAFYAVPCPAIRRRRCARRYTKRSKVEGAGRDRRGTGHVQDPARVNLLRSLGR